MMIVVMKVGLIVLIDDDDNDDDNDNDDDDVSCDEDGFNSVD